MNEPEKIDGFDSLCNLALDMRWSWSHSTDGIWRELNPELWDDTHNPWVVLQTASRDKIKTVLTNTEFRKNVDDLCDSARQAKDAPAWFQQHHAQSPLTSVAYFSMEFMLSEALPIYSGGLGNVAGDQLKAASDLGVPVVGVGLLYQQGYFRQVIGKYGEQQALYPYNDPGQLPISPVREANGEWLRLEIALPGFSVWLRVWEVRVGRVKLYLLDTNDAANFPAHRGIASELYGGGPELRLKQEMVLGIGGWRLLGALGIQPEVCHLNEGHAAFAVLERARSFMEETGQPFEVALAATRAGNLFTTHTAVPAGFDRFSHELIEQYLGNYAQDKLGIGIQDLLALGRSNPFDSSEPFNMAYLAMRGSGPVNGVSKLHGKVSREIFLPLFPRWTRTDVPVGYVTNGVHMPTWDSASADALWTEACGKDRWLKPTDDMEQNIFAVSDAKLWEMRTNASKSLVEYARGRLAQQLAVSGSQPDVVERARHLFDPGILTIGFARRFATYKRPDLLLHDEGRLYRLLTNAERPVQLIIAGKAHPADQPGQDLIQRWVQFARRPEIRPHVIFLADYDMLLTENLVQGVDVWLNTPRRPWEACGTSGMKVLVNGGVNVSELDGWWAEAYSPKVGWALGDGQEHGDDPAWDAAEAEALYGLLEREVIPEFYQRDDHGIPTVWVQRMRESMATLTPRFSAGRAVRDYTEAHYLPAASAYRARTANKGEKGKQVVDWRHALDGLWSGLRFGEVKVETRDGRHAFEAQLFIGELGPDAVSAELYADGVQGGDPVRVPMKRAKQTDGGSYAYRGDVSAERPANEYTARVIPFLPDGASLPGGAAPLESNHILWQR
jgi:starch phosphorylase